MYICKKQIKISTNKLHIEKFKSNFENIYSILIVDIIDFYRKLDNKTKKSTINWRIHKLVEKGIIQRIGRGKYTLGKQKIFIPIISNENELLFSKLKEEFPYLNISIWSTKWLTPWMLHIPNKNKTIIEVEKGTEENVFYFLKDFKENIFLNPSNNILEKYAATNENIIIIKNLITDAPLQKIKKIQISSIEKILVDLIVEVEMFSEYQGVDLENIIENAFEYNTINTDKMLRYANRRRKKNIVQQKINNILI